MQNKIFREIINKQFEFNKGKNLFKDGIIDSLKFCPEILKAIDEIDLPDTDSEKILIDYLTGKALQEFCEINQYYTFNKQDQAALKGIYVELYTEIKKDKTSIGTIAKKHYENLINWLQKTNSFAEPVYSSKSEIVEPVACSEYSAGLQMKTLQIDIHQIIEPVLDVGCGKQGNTVNYLRQTGIEAYGFDRFATDSFCFKKSDWFDFNFEKDKWGTIISNLGFSNHFYHHHLRMDGNFIGYGKKFMEILSSLKPGGSFHYAPDLPFIECYLDENKYQITKHSIENFEFKSSKIKRLR